MNKLLELALLVVGGIVVANLNKQQIAPTAPPTSGQPITTGGTGTTIDPLNPNLYKNVGAAIVQDVNAVETWWHEVTGL